MVVGLIVFGVYLAVALFIGISGSVQSGGWDKLMWAVGFLWPILLLSAGWNWVKARI